MTITVADAANSTVIQLDASTAVPGQTNITIYAKSSGDVWEIIYDLGLEYTNVQFTNPCRTADGRWGAIGSVSN